MQAPRYGEASLADLLPSILAGLGVPDEPNPLGLGRFERIVVFVVDGLGWRQLQEHADTARYLADLPATVLDSVFPSTTAASIASIGTGLPPSRHGLVGYAVGVEGETQPLNLLTWRVGLRGGGADARDRIVPEDYQPLPTAFERASRSGVTTISVLRPEFPGSGLTRAALRGSTEIVATGLRRTLDAAIAAASSAPAPTLVYAYHGSVDETGHSHGPGSPEWLAALTEVDRELAAAAARLPRGVALLVTSDHGMLRIPEDRICELADRPELDKGVRVLAGEPRVRQVYADPGQADDVLARWRQTLDGAALVLGRDEAFERGLFGPDPRPAVRRLVGDVVAVAREGSLPHRRVDPRAGRLPGQHGGLTRAEIEVPLLRLDAG